MRNYINLYEGFDKYTEKGPGFDNPLQSNLIIYDRKTNKYFNRTPSDWIRFSTLFFSCLIAMIGIFVGMFFTFTEGVINEDRPYRSGSGSFLSVPSLSIRPHIDFKTSLIKYTDSNPASYVLYIENMKAFLQTYEDAGLVSEESYAQCTNGEKIPNDIKKSCRFNLDLLQTCRKQYNFGFDRTRPCVILKLNKIYGWIPDTVNSSLSEDILVSCNGLHTEDIEYFPDGIRYYPNVTINNTVFKLYYPYMVQYGYRQPLVAVELEKPKKNVILMVKCRIINLKLTPLPLIFEILVD